MKRILTAIICATLALSGCTPKADKAAEVATGFLTEFFNMNYAGAASLCSDDIAAMIKDTIAADEYPSEEIRAKVVEASRNTTFKIVSCEMMETSDTVVVCYEIYPFGAAGNTPIPHSMSLLREGGNWKIVALE